MAVSGRGHEHELRPRPRFVCERGQEGEYRLNPKATYELRLRPSLRTSTSTSTSTSMSTMGSMRLSRSRVGLRGEFGFEFDQIMCSTRARKRGRGCTMVGVSLWSLS